MLVSVIIPCYNSEKYLKDTVESVFMQSYEMLEIILIDDGSEDNTWDIIRELKAKDKRIKGIKQSNQGVSAARNKGIDISRGDLITFLDSDDIYEKDKVLEQVNKIKESGKRVCYTGNKYVFKNKEIDHVYNLDGKIIEYYIVDSVMIHLNDWMIKSEVIKNNNIRFNEKFRYGEDVNFFMKILMLEEVISVNKQLTKYFIRNTSSSFNFSIRENNEDNYISDFKGFIKENRSFIYSKKEIEKIERALDTFLLPRVIIQNILYCNKKFSELNDFEKDSINKFEFNLKNLKSSIKFKLLYLKLRLKI